MPLWKFPFSIFLFSYWLSLFPRYFSFSNYFYLRGFSFALLSDLFYILPFLRISSTFVTSKLTYRQITHTHTQTHTHARTHTHSISLSLWSSSSIFPTDAEYLKLLLSVHLCQDYVFSFNKISLKTCLTFLKLNAEMIPYHSQIGSKCKHYLHLAVSLASHVSSSSPLLGISPTQSFHTSHPSVPSVSTLLRGQPRDILFILDKFITNFP